MIKRNEEWLKSLKVREIDYVETSYTLENITQIKNNNTNILQDERQLWTLYINPSSNILDISRYIIKFIFVTQDFRDVSHVNTLLATSLLSLKEMGYPVDRLLKQPNLQHVVDQMIVNQINEENLNNHWPDTEISSTDSSSNLQFSEACPLSFPSDSSPHTPTFYTGNYNNVKSENQISVITFETTLVLRNSLQNAINGCYLNLENNVNSQSNDTINDNDQTNININRNFYNPTINANRIVNNQDCFQNRVQTINDENQVNQTDYCDIIPGIIII
jgi:hypothetical protein